MVENARAAQPSLLRCFFGVDCGADGEEDRHGADHERGVRDGGEREAFELQEELQGNSHEGSEHEHTPLGCVEVWTVREEQRQKADEREGETVEDHCANTHFGEGDLAEVEATTPEAAGEERGQEAEGAVFCEGGHKLVSHGWFSLVVSG